jgi:hypothetical protein
MWNADELESALARNREVLAGVEDDEQRSRREEAMDQMLRYVALLRVAASGEHVSGRSQLNRSFAFKLELEDGRWDVEEKSLTIAPRVGDVLSFEDGRQWRVRASQLVRPRPAHKPAREFFVCAPAA